ncbi:hypothetical protein SSX86_028806 [Deinandra increscens subsp. villosa]|uniref:Transferase, Chloramphenicol acetyltransferase-like domain protein n=1 Tax=Deinandra increscens subsp. villosa TaxID=3103831 RepID=A0AAP0CEX8_9ASTR
MIMTRFQRLLKSRQLHTIISQETIKPSSPTPPHLRIHNLSLVDQLAPNVSMPLIFFYKNYRKGSINILKKSLSQTLTSYYPFAGRSLEPSVPQIECNDQGVEFLEASNDTRLIDFILKKELDETIDQLIPNYTFGNKDKLLKVQLNHLSCGGVAMVVSISHKVADGYTVGKFINHWATVTRGGSPKNPTFLSSKCKIKIPEIDLKGTNKVVKYTTSRFVFPNSKLNELKNKVNASVNPTRVEILSSLIFKCAVGAATRLSGCIPPSNMYHLVNMRNKITGKNPPEIAAGNICSIAVAKMAGTSEIKLHKVIDGLRKDKTEIKEVGDVEEVGEVLLNKMSTLGGDESRIYAFSSVCRFPFYDVDFGWGNPVQLMIKNGVIEGNVITLMDTPSGEGIEAIVQLEAEEMSLFQKDKEILAYSQDIKKFAV